MSDPLEGSEQDTGAARAPVTGPGSGDEDQGAEVPAVVHGRLILPRRFRSSDLMALRSGSAYHRITSAELTATVTATAATKRQAAAIGDSTGRSYIL